MGPDDVAAWSDAVGPTFIAVIALAVVIIPLLRRARSETHDLPAAVQVEIALMKADVADHEKRVDALEHRVALLEIPKRRSPT